MPVMALSAFAVFDLRFEGEIELAGAARLLRAEGIDKLDEFVKGERCRKRFPCRRGFVGEIKHPAWQADRSVIRMPATGFEPFDGVNGACSPHG